jgi:hypothetical protein
MCSLLNSTYFFNFSKNKYKLNLIIDGNLFVCNVKKLIGYRFKFLKIECKIIYLFNFIYK